ncbi:MAG: hypothetical protein K6T57_15325 [Thermaceae bacterium]|nr:hypothetical protein [Thermaceae bacterium]
MDKETLKNIHRQAEGLVGGMALPNGVLFMSTHGVGWASMTGRASSRASATP